MEGFHALKHALRFGASVELVVTRDLEYLRQLCRTFATDIEERVGDAAVTVAPEVFARLAPVPPETGVIAIARRRVTSAARLLAAPRAAPVVLLERPSHLGNVGAVIRVAAAAGAAGVITTGAPDPWHPTAVRTAAGLHFAVPVARAVTLPGPEGIRGPLLAIDPEGEPLSPGAIPPQAVLAFGSERHGLSLQLLFRAERRIAIPMEPGVSSLNLATAVAVVLYTWRLELGR